MTLLRRNRHHGSCSTLMHKHRMGGKVSLFNYNPSIAGGKIGGRRYSGTHRRGEYITHYKETKTPPAIATIPVTVTDGHPINPFNPKGKATTERKKRIMESISKHMDQGGKRMRRA